MDLMMILTHITGIALGTAIAVYFVLRFLANRLKQIHLNKNDIEEIMETVVMIGGKLKQVSNGVGRISGFLGAKDLIDTTGQIMLNGAGREVSSHIDALGIAIRYKNKPEIAEDATMYEIQELAFDYARDKLFDDLDDDEKRKLETYAFDNGKNLPTLLTVIGFELRDTVFRDRDMPVMTVESPSEDSFRP